MTSRQQGNNEPAVTAGPAGAQAPPTAPAPSPGGAAPTVPQHRVRRTRVSGVWVAVACFALVLLLLLIFILQNGHTVDVSYFGAHGHLPLGVALLLSAVSGALLVCLLGSARIIQLRSVARRHSRSDARLLAGGQPADPQPSRGGADRSE